MLGIEAELGNEYGQSLSESNENSEYNGGHEIESNDERI